MNQVTRCFSIKGTTSPLQLATSPSWVCQIWLNKPRPAMLGIKSFYIYNAASAHTCAMYHRCSCQRLPWSPSAIENNHRSKLVRPEKGDERSTRARKPKSLNCERPGCTNPIAELHRYRPGICISESSPIVRTSGLATDRWTVNEHKDAP